MSMSKFALTVSAVGAALAFCSCNTRPAEWEDEWVAQDIVAAPAAKGQIKIDGVISPGEWDDAQAYQLSRAKEWGYEKLLPRQRAIEDRTPFERGFFKVKYDSEYLYVLGSMEDKDLVQTARENQKLAFGTGDMIEVLLKPESKSAYWELYGTPWNHCTTLFYPWRGHSYMENQSFNDGIKVAVMLRGTINKDDDEDSGWDIEMAIPRTLIEKTGEEFAPGKEWRILLGRYNYGKNLPSKQVSSTPRLPRTNHHIPEYYSKLKFKEAPAENKNK